MQEKMITKYYIQSKILFIVDYSMGIWPIFVIFLPLMGGRERP